MPEEDSLTIYTWLYCTSAAKGPPPPASFYELLRASICRRPQRRLTAAEVVASDFVRQQNDTHLRRT